MRGEPYQNLGFDPAGGYRDAGYMVSGQPVPSVASVQFLAGMNPDSTLALLGLSLANEALSFRRVDAQFEARYEVEIACYSGEEPVARLASEEAVRVATYVETQRRDESVVFQRFFNLPPGAVTATIVLTDRLSGDSTSITQQWRVPRLGVGSGEAALVMVYRGAMRRDATVGPELVVNPRAYAAYGLDTLAIYLEAYDNEAVASATVSISDGSGSLQWQDTVTLSHRGSGLVRDLLR